MPFHLIFLFLLQSGLAFAFSFFIVRIILGGSEGESREKSRTVIRKTRNVVLGFSVILPPVMFFAYYKSLPPGQSTSLAVWPAAWILMILGAVVLALSVANHGRFSKTQNR